MKTHRTVLKMRQIRKANAFLRNWANRTESDDLADLILSSTIRAERGRKVVLRGIFF